MTELPIDPHLPHIVDTVLEKRRLVLEAPPGAGKTTRVPPALLDRLPGKILVLEPRRIAARASAERVAAELGEALGERVGYRVRFESKPGRRLDYVTEGVFLRMLQSDALAEVSAVVFDEFHERHLDGDLSLALVESLSRTRKDLHLLVMSATLDAEPIAKHLDAPRVRSEGQSYPVDIQYSQGRDERRLEARVASGIRALWHHPGDVLVFLPGVGEIERCREALKGVDAELLTLHGQLSAKDQRRVFAPSDRRRVVLATNVAETSITVDGITAVIDTGLARIPRWDASSGLARLSLTPISRASAIQRAGRAGRTAPGVCLRLYPRSDFDARDAHTPAEILRADATPLLLAVYRSGYRIDELNWLTPPPSASVDAARSTLERLGAIEEERLTSRGEQLARLPLHPRLGALLLDAAEHGARNDGALAAALVSERDFVPRGPAEAVGESDLEWRIELLRRRQPPARVHRPTLYRVREVARQLERLATDGERASADPLRRAVFRAFSDRLAKRMGESEGRIQVLLSAGGRAELAENSVVRDSEWMVALGTEMRGPRGREKTTVTLASAVEREWIEEELAGEIRAVEDLKLESGRVMQTEGFKLGELWLDRDHRPAPPGDETSEVLFAELDKRGLVALFSEESIEHSLGRLEVAARTGISLSASNAEEALLRAACAHATTIDEVRNRELDRLLHTVVDPAAVGTFEQRVPRAVELPSGRTLKVHYARGRGPWIESYLQDFFGMPETPRAGGEPVTVHLWAPNRRPVQVTTDLASFWTQAYPELKRSLSRRYPKHVWPDDPRRADPTRLKRHLGKN